MDSRSRRRTVVLAQPASRPLRKPSLGKWFKSGLSILAEYEALDKAGKGALLRREYLYSSLICARCDQRDCGAVQALAAPLGRPEADPRESEKQITQLEAENAKSSRNRARPTP